MPRTLIGLMVCALASGCATESRRVYDASEPDLRTMIYPPAPTWALDSTSEGYFFNIDRLMETYRWERWRAIEAQARARGILAADERVSIAEAFERARAEPAEGLFASRWKVRPGEIVVAVELEGVLLAQWDLPKAAARIPGVVADRRLKPEGEAETSGTEIAVHPGAERFLRRVRAMRGVRGLVAFTRKTEASARSALAAWKLADGRPATELFDGIFTRDHLVLSGASPRAFRPSKDLRAVDPAVERVLSVDPAPETVLQTDRVLRVPADLQADLGAVARAIAGYLIR